MADPEVASSVVEEVAEALVTEEPLVGTFDIVLLSLLALVSLYYFVLKDRNKKDEIPPLKTFTISTTQLARQTSETGFVTKLKTSARNIVVFYGSQTGTAEEFAGRLAKEASRYGMKGMVADPEEVDMSDLSQLGEIENNLAIFCMATYGEGDPTDNAQEFHEFLQSGDSDLAGVNYVVFGLGNKTYEHYNSMAKFVDKRMEEMSGSRIYSLGLGDDDANMEDDFITWKDLMWPKVCEHFGIEASGEEVNMRQYGLTILDEYNPEKLFTGEIARLNSYKNQRPPFDAKNPYMAEIIVNKELHKAGDRSGMHVELNIEGSRIRYDCGDHVAIYPTNDSALVEKIGKLAETDLETVFKLTNLDEDSTKKHPFPCPTTYRTALTHYVDIMQLPRTHIIKELVEYTSDPQEKEKLALMASTTDEGKALYQKWVIGELRSISHILQDLPSCKPSLDHLCELLPRLQPRYYSISSSPKVHPTTIHVTGVHVSYDTPTGRRNNGVCTTWIRNMRSSEETFKVPIFVRKSQFRLPNKSTTPIVMIGPGTGLAPFRGFIQERNHQRDQGKETSDNLLFFGCRYRGEDFIYEDELTTYQESKLLTLHCAFSRDQQEKVYVTHLLKQQAAEVWRIIGKENGHLYVCGDAKIMARDVTSILHDICQTEGEMTLEEADAYLKKMISLKRYSSDVWS